MHSTLNLHLPKKAPSHRQLRVGEEVRRIISSFLMRGDFFTSVPMGSVTVTEVSISPDLRRAVVYIAPLARATDMDDVLTALKEVAYLMRKQVSKEMRMKFTPTLQFKYDDSFDQAEHIERLLLKLNPGS